MDFKRKHHQQIAQVLKSFNHDYLEQNGILFGGGTRISLELGEYRESVDIDFLCPSNGAYRAVREQVTNKSLGSLISTPVQLPRDIRMNRDAVRTVVQVEDTPIKLEFVNMDGYNLKASASKPFGVPMLNKDSCYITKLLAHSDRKYFPDKKDFFDLLAMGKAWGAPGQGVWQECERKYGSAPFADLKEQLTKACNDKAFAIEVAEAGEKLGIERPVIQDLVLNQAPALLKGLDMNIESSQNRISQQDFEPDL